MKDRVQYSRNVPRWFTYVHHMISRRQCRRIGHTITHWPTICDHCGEILTEVS